jgi:hypothetical protein
LEKQLSVFATAAVTESPARSMPSSCGSCGNPGGPGACAFNR